MDSTDLFSHGLRAWKVRSIEPSEAEKRFDGLRIGREERQERAKIDEERMSVAKKRYDDYLAKADEKAKEFFEERDHFATFVSSEGADKLKEKAIAIFGLTGTFYEYIALNKFDINDFYFRRFFAAGKRCARRRT